MAGSAIWVSQTLSPVRRSKATRRASSVPRKTLSPKAATPRLFGPQQKIVVPRRIDVSQRTAPVFAFSRSTRWTPPSAGVVMYISPSITTGVVSYDLAIPVWWIHLTESDPTLLVLMSVSGE